MKKLLILTFMIVFALGNRSEGVNLLMNGDFPVDGDETGWTQFEDRGGTWSVASGVGTMKSNAGGSCGLMWYQVVDIPVGVEATISADWLADMKADGFWAEVMLMTFEDAFAPDTVYDGGWENKLQAAYSAPWTIQTLASRVATGDLGDYNSYGNDGVGGIVYKKDGWGMNTTVNSWTEESVSLSPYVPPTSVWPTKPKQDWVASSTITSMGDVVVVLKLGGSDRTGDMPGEYRELSFDNVVLDVAVTPGDANMDGKVDGSDVTILAGNWQVGVDGTELASWTMGDFNADGKVDGSDVTILAGNWQAGVTSSTASVPEPTTLLLLLTVIGSAMIWKRRS